MEGVIAPGGHGSNAKPDVGVGLGGTGVHVALGGGGVNVAVGGTGVNVAVGGTVAVASGVSVGRSWTMTKTGLDSVRRPSTVSAIVVNA